MCCTPCCAAGVPRSWRSESPLPTDGHIRIQTKRPCHHDRMFLTWFPLASYVLGTVILFELFRYTKFAPQDFFMQVPGCNLVLSLSGAEATQRVLARFNLSRYSFQNLRVFQWIHSGCFCLSLSHTSVPSYLRTHFSHQLLKPITLHSSIQISSFGSTNSRSIKCHRSGCILAPLPGSELGRGPLPHGTCRLSQMDVSRRTHRLGSR